ncbi:putative P-loop containing nucleoside triphosphate hydrolase, leucine-rich repeat domain, L [Rosa chinensis]|uniref:Putative P-loop containing nucleoside triphosphate hydrolase, leucine-rich repeat domain, L n=1 Tax=Rosa chinensis TaxID=74649 RepID=A0A2P6PF00_ROSCH|nr:putative P-loop containing nucleoside triphosphate hydrolase, leucine-rich repeat domain, L [Rosa chinensis]
MAELALVNLLLKELFTVAFDQTKEAVTLVLTAKAEVEKFSSNLKAIQAVLQDAEKQQVEKASVRNWLDQLNDVSYEMVDVLDEWNTEILKQKAKGVATEKKKTFKKVCFCIPSNCFCFGQVNKASHLYKIATEIKDLNEKLTSIAAQKNDFEFHESSISNVEQLNQPLKTSSIVDISTIFGREEATTDLLSKLLSDRCEEGKRVLVIPIVGMGGMGKTTLAQLAYNHENVKTYFEKRIWVCVSDPFDEVKIAKSIISGTGNDAPNSTELEDVLQCMSRSLQGEKYLIVLDDVWTEEETKWDNLKLSVIMQSCAIGSRILVTTRKKGVAEMMKADAHMIQIEKLSDKTCFELFSSIAFLNREEDKANGFGDIGEKIVEKCDGLPLAIKCLGKLMHRKKTIGEWQNVLDSKIWDLNVVKQEVFRPLLLSYYGLAPIVKRCLLYCATFPKDYRFNKHNLIELWMSQDYLSGKEYKEKEETGEYVFDTLVMQSFFQDVVEEIHSWDKSITTFCKMHDIVHDFVQFLNKNEYFTIEAKKANAGMMIISEEVRHLSLRYVRRSPLLDFLSPVNCKKLRTLATFDSRMSRIDMKAISQLRCLRTLNLSYSYIQELPEEIGELIHLRYLDLTNNVKLTKLPDSLGNLYNLQTLCLSRCWWIKALPENMGNLINLRHLHTKHCELLEYLPRGVARLISLQTLDVCPVNDEGLKLGDLGSLDQLQGTLLINIKGNLKDTSEAQKACLWNKKLYYLELSFSRLEEQSHVQVQVLEALRPHQDLETLNIISYGGTTAPSWMISLQNLRSLSLHTWDGCEFLPPLGKMPFLEQLSVTRLEKVKTVGDEFLGTQTSSSFVLFPKLKELTFDRMEEWEQWEGVGGWTESGGADESTIMPCLVSFTIKDCPKLKNLPLFLQDTQVRKISISKCRRSIITPVWPDNCDVDISEELEDPEIPNTTER